MTSNTPRQNCDESQITTQEDVLSYFRKVGNADIGVYSLHLKSNLVTHGNAEIGTAQNIRKREVSIQQLLAISTT